MSTSRPRPGGVHTDSIRGHVLYAPCLKGNSLLRAPRSSTFNFIDARRISRYDKNVHVILRFVLSLFEFYNPWILQRISSTRELASSKKGRSNAERERERELFRETRRSAWRRRGRGVPSIPFISRPPPSPRSSPPRITVRPVSVGRGDSVVGGCSSSERESILRSRFHEAGAWALSVAAVTRGTRDSASVSFERGTSNEIRNKYRCSPHALVAVRRRGVLNCRIGRESASR